MVPNSPVAVDAWEESACYPRGNFYPISDGTSIRNHQITKSYFRICSTCGCRSQAPLCLYTRFMVSNHDEGTFERLRYSFGGDRPSQTAHLTLSRRQIHGYLLEFQFQKGGIPTLTPPKLTPWFHSLPPILYMQRRISISSYSKAPWGLSV